MGSIDRTTDSEQFDLLAVLVVAVLGFHFPVTTSLLVQFFLLSLMGIYFSVIGFCSWVRVDAKTIDTIGFPVIILAAMTIIPFDTLGASGGFMDLVGSYNGLSWLLLYKADPRFDRETNDRCLSIGALCCCIWIEFAIFLSARTQRENGELRTVK